MSLADLSQEGLLDEIAAVSAALDERTALEAETARQRLPAEVVAMADRTLKQWNEHGQSLMNAFLAGRWPAEAEGGVCLTEPFNEAEMRVGLLKAMSIVLLGPGWHHRSREEGIL